MRRPNTNHSAGIKSESVEIVVIAHWLTCRVLLMALMQAPAARAYSTVDTSPCVSLLFGHHCFLLFLWWHKISLGSKYSNALLKYADGDAKAKPIARNGRLPLLANMAISSCDEPRRAKIVGMTPSKI